MKLFLLPIVVLAALSLPAFSYANTYREVCVFSLGSYPQFKTSIDVIGPKTFGNILSVYSIDGGYIQLYLGQAAKPQPGEKFRFVPAPNVTLTAFVLKETDDQNSSQPATLYFPASAYGTSMAGVCKFVGP